MPLVTVTSENQDEEMRFLVSLFALAIAIAMPCLAQTPDPMPNPLNQIDCCWIVDPAGTDTAVCAGEVANGCNARARIVNGMNNGVGVRYITCEQREDFTDANGDPAHRWVDDVLVKLIENAVQSPLKDGAEVGFWIDEKSIHCYTVWACDLVLDSDGQGGTCKQNLLSEEGVHYPHYFNDAPCDLAWLYQFSQDDLDDMDAAGDGDDIIDLLEIIVENIIDEIIDEIIADADDEDMSGMDDSEVL